MATLASTTELRKMSVADLRKEVSEKRAEVAKLHIGVQMKTEKDTAKFAREKKHLARLLTILVEKESGEESAKTLKSSQKTSTVPASDTETKPASRKRKAS